MSLRTVVTISDEVKKVSFSDVDEIVHREEESTEVYKSIEIRGIGGIIKLHCKTRLADSVDKNDRPFFIVDISIAEGQLVAIVQDSKDENELQYHVPVRSIKSEEFVSPFCVLSRISDRWENTQNEETDPDSPTNLSPGVAHRVTELREAVERLNSQANYFKFDQDVIKFVKEVTAKTPLELRREKLVKTVAAPPTETRKRRREEEVVEENPAKRAKCGDVKNEEKQCTEPEFSPKKLQSTEKGRCEEKSTEAEKYIDDQVYSFKNLIGVGFTADGLMLFRILWSTNEKTWEPWMEFKDYTRCIKKMVRRELRDGFEFTKQQKKTFEANTGLKLRKIYKNL